MNETSQSLCRSPAYDGLGRHELRTPLLAIGGAVELLLSGGCGPLTSQARRLISDVGTAGVALERAGNMLIRLAELAMAPSVDASRLSVMAWCKLLGLPTVPLLTDRPHSAVWAVPAYLEELGVHLRGNGLLEPELARDAGAVYQADGELFLRLEWTVEPDGSGVVAFALGTRLATASQGRVHCDGSGATILAWRLAG